MSLNFFCFKAINGSIKIRTVLIFIIAFFIQAYSAYLLFNYFLMQALVLHGVSASLFPWALRRCLPARFRQDRAILVLLFLMCWLVPLVSGLGLLLSLSIGIYYAKPIVKEITNTVELDSVPEGVLSTVQLSQYDEGSILGILESSGVEDQRIKAVLKTRQMLDQEAIPILKVALRDPIDEVRLLAYSMLDKKEKVIDKLIHSELKKLAVQTLENQEAIHLKLAEFYWELSYLGLVAGQAQLHILRDAYEHVKLALEKKEDNADALFLQARIALALNFYEVARDSLNKAVEKGVSPVRTAPYQAELAFMTRRFDDIEQYLKAVDDTAKDHEVVSGMVQQWG